MAHTIPDQVVSKARDLMGRHRAGSSPRPDLTASCSCGAIEPATSEGWIRQAEHPLREALEAVAPDLIAVELSREPSDAEVAAVAKSLFLSALRWATDADWVSAHPEIRSTYFERARAILRTALDVRLAAVRPADGGGSSQDSTSTPKEERESSTVIPHAVAVMPCEVVDEGERGFFQCISHEAEFAPGESCPA